MLCISPHLYFATERFNVYGEFDGVANILVDRTYCTLRTAAFHFIYSKLSQALKG